jgi:hypothetical protein
MGSRLGGVLPKDDRVDFLDVGACLQAIRHVNRWRAPEESLASKLLQGWESDLGNTPLGFVLLVTGVVGVGTARIRTARVAGAGAGVGAGMPAVRGMVVRGVAAGRLVPERRDGVQRTQGIERTQRVQGTERIGRIVEIVRFRFWAGLGVLRGRVDHRNDHTENQDQDDDLNHNEVPVRP